MIVHMHIHKYEINITEIYHVLPPVGGSHVIYELTLYELTYLTY